MCRGDASDIAWAAQDVQSIGHRIESGPSDPVLQEAYELLRNVAKTELPQSLRQSVTGWASSEYRRISRLEPERLFGSDSSLGWIGRFCGTYYLERRERVEVAIQRVGAARTLERDQFLGVLSGRKGGPIFFCGDDMKDDLGRAAESVQLAMYSMANY